MGWLVLGLRPAGTRGVRSDSKEACARHEVGMSFARDDGGGGPTETEVRALMKVLIGVDPHKTSLALAAVDESSGELLEHASFPQDRTGLRSLERWSARFPERRSKRWRTPAASVAIWRADWRRPASPWWTFHPSFRRG